MSVLPVLSVSECVKSLNDVLATQVVCVEGEVQGFSLSQGRWGFFALKDLKDGAIIECFTMAFRVPSALVDGSLVRVVATPSIYAKSGRFRLVVENIELAGAGELKQLFEKLRAKLAAEGLFAPERKRKIATWPKQIGLVASIESAAYSDFLKVLAGRFADIEVIVANVQVQGPAAVKSIQQALHHLGELSPPLDAIVLTRGGGSLEDLMAFNDEALVRTIFKCPVPVVTAVGHERDLSLVDLVADLKASTPSNAAELIVPHRREVVTHVQVTKQRMMTILQHRLSERAHDVDRYAQWFTDVLTKNKLRVDQAVSRIIVLINRGPANLSIQTNELQRQARRISAAMGVSLDSINNYLTAKSKLFQQLHPHKLLQRGYSIVRVAGQVVQSKQLLKLGSALNITLADGEVGAKVTNLN
jgi:exodeoxyribonuclease VII large subunit